MKATIVHESRGRMRLRLRQKNMSLRQADLLETWLKAQSWTKEAVVHERTCCVSVTYAGERETVLSAIGGFTWTKAEESVTLPSHSIRELNREFQEKLVGKVLMKGAAALFLPAPLRVARVIWHMAPFLHKGFRCLNRGKIKVELLDALSIGISVGRRDFGTAGMVMFLLEIGELLEDWTRKKSVADLAESLSLHVDRVWLKTEADEVLTPIGQIQPGDWVVVRAGGVIPLDGVVAEGEITVNQASLTGESVPVAKRPGGAVYAGTVVEEGECVLEVKQASGRGRYDQIVEMIQRSEQMKSAAEAKASSLADRLVPYTFAGSLLSLALTRNVTRALSVLMVDFSCALKLAMPLAVLSAMREAGREHITVKGGKFLEAVAQADTIVFDKTGTLTHACPRVARIVPFNGKEEAEMLRLAACLEEHFPHSMANAVVEEAHRRGLTHEERHARVEYLVAHGIASSVDGEQVRIGSAHFIFEDEKVTIPEGEQAKFDALPPEYLRPPAGGGAGRAHRPAGPGCAERRHAHRGQSPHRRRRRGAAGGGRLPGRGAPGGQGGLCGRPPAGGPHRPHGGGRHQRLPGPLRGGRGHRHQRRGGHRPGDRRHHHRRRQPVGAGAPAAAGRGAHGPHPEQLPLRHRLQRGADWPGRGGRAAPRYLRHAPQPVHPGGEPPQHERPAGGRARDKGSEGSVKFGRSPHELILIID